MKPTPKADECIKMMQKIEDLNFMFSVSVKEDPLTDEMLNKWKYKKDKFFKFNREAFNNLSYWVDYCSIIINYRLLPASGLKHIGDSNFKQYNGRPILDGFSTFIDKHLTGVDKQILWEVLTNFDEVTKDDLKNEFWSIIPDLASIPEYYNVMKIKYKEVFSEIPDTKYYSYGALIEDTEFMAYYESLIKYGVLQRGEVESLLLKLCIVFRRLDIVCNTIVETYKSFLLDQTPSLDKEHESSETSKTDIPMESSTEEGLEGTPHFNSSYTKEELERFFNRLKEDRYLHPDTKLDDWLYICGVNKDGSLITPLKWMKDQDELAHLVNTLFGDTDSNRLWVITEKAFTIKDKPPNINSMKNSVSKINSKSKDKPPKLIKMDDILTL